MNDVKTLRKKLEKLGFTCTRNKRGNFKVTREGRYIAMLPGNPTSGRALLNTLVKLRQAGIAI